MHLKNSLSLDACLCAMPAPLRGRQTGGRVGPPASPESSTEGRWRAEVRVKSHSLLSYYEK
ncbi:MAG: hypothetical protein JRJ70_04000 [Deltaproteobacteria bacterium]|nr:hypothetical protein [Deltaproteobacteria bacterium]